MRAAQGSYGIRFYPGPAGLVGPERGAPRLCRARDDSGGFDGQGTARSYRLSSGEARTSVLGSQPRIPGSERRDRALARGTGRSRPPRPVAPRGGRIPGGLAGVADRRRDGTHLGSLPNPQRPASPSRRPGCRRSGGRCPPVPAGRGEGSSGRVGRIGIRVERGSVNCQQGGMSRYITPARKILK